MEDQTDIDNLSPVTCNETVLAGMAASAQQVDAPIAPFPLFFSNSQCGGGLGSSFPSLFLPVTCSDDHTQPLNSLDNCLRILSAANFDRDKTPITNAQINTLNVITWKTDPPHFPDAANQKVQSNIFPGYFDKLYSFYIPPQYTALFFSEPIPDGESKTWNGILADVETYHMIFGPNHLEVDACRSNLAVQSTTNSPLTFLYDISKDIASQPSAPTSSQCLNGAATNGPITGQPAGNILNTAARHFILLQNEEFNDMIVGMCTSGREVIVGDTSLATVWFPQSPGCDKFMTNLCQSSSASGTEYSETCSCFQQQTKLNERFGVDLKVPVCCFGQDDSENIDMSCAFNGKAYKTTEMLKNCCSFAECNKAVIQGNMGDVSEETGVLCQGTFVEFPKKPKSAIPVLPEDTFETNSDIPGWVWAMFGIGTALLLFFVISLAFL
jgi:hypothetical protein